MKSPSSWQELSVGTQATEFTQRKTNSSKWDVVNLVLFYFNFPIYSRSGRQEGKGEGERYVEVEVFFWGGVSGVGEEWEQE